MSRDERNAEVRQRLSGLAFCSPWLIGFVLLFLWPFAASLYWSFCQYDLVNSPEWVGIENYARLADEIYNQRGFGLALTNTFYYALLAVPLSIVVGVTLALLLSANVPGQSAFRAAVFLPSIIPVVAGSVLWMWLLDPTDGMINYLFSWVGLGDQNWLNQSRSFLSPESVQSTRNAFASDQPLRLFGSKDALVLMSIWGVGNFVVIYLAAISDIPRSLYEAAEMDGAGPIQKVFTVTLPMLSPVIFFNLVMGIIKSVQTFTSIYILSEGTGEPGGSLTMISLHLFLAAFSDLEMGYASAIAWILFVALLVITLFLFRTSKQWVHYRVST